MVATALSKREKIVHVTERQSFKDCRAYWHWNYREGLQTKKESVSALFWGRGIHFGLAEYYRSKMTVLPVDAFDAWFSRRYTIEQWANLWEGDKQKITEGVTLVRSMLTRYPIFARDRDKDWEILNVELPIRRRIPGTYIYMVGTIDLLVRWKGKLWVVDHKGYASFIDPAQLEIDDQMTSYLWLVWQVFKELPGGAIYNQLRKSIPAQPMQLKAGGLSKAKSIDTTVEIYRQAIDDLGLDERDYAEILQQIRGNEFYRREPIGRTKTELTLFTSQLVDEVREMVYPQIPIYPHFTRDCMYCDYLILCRAKQTGGDLKALKRDMFDVSFERQE